MAEGGNVWTVEQILNAFQRGEYHKMPEFVTEDVRWSVPGVPQDPCARDFDGRDGVTQFFSHFVNEWQVDSFAPEEWFISADSVAVAGNAVLKSRHAGNVVETPWVMLFDFAGGKVRRFRMLYDTAAVSVAFGWIPGPMAQEAQRQQRAA